MKTELAYSEWLTTVNKSITRWRMWRLEVYRLATYLGELTLLDLGRIRTQFPGFRGDIFLLHAGKIGAKIAFGYGPSFRTVQLQGFNEALAAAKETRLWYVHSRDWLGEVRTTQRLFLVDTIIHQLYLLTQIPPAFDPERYDEENWERYAAQEWDDMTDSDITQDDNSDFFI
jgi:hypothetical protein